MKVKKIPVYVFFILSLFNLSALDWPTDTKSALLVFGSMNNGHYLNGVILDSRDGIVRAAESGDMFFYLDKTQLPGGFPSPLGGLVVIEDQDGLSTIYGSLNPDSISTYLKSVSKNDVLGQIYKPSTGLFFVLYDSEKDKNINPFIFMEPPLDVRPPVIKSAGLVQGEKILILGNTRIIKQGTYELIASIEDSENGSPANSKRVPYRIRVFVDGIQRIDFLYETSMVKNGELVYFNSQIPADKFWRPDGFLSLGTFMFSRGKANIIITAMDFTGNERQVSFSIQVD